MKYYSHRRLAAFLALAASTLIAAEAPVALPEGVGKNAIFLSANPQGTFKPEGVSAVLPAELIQQTAKEVVTGDPTMLLLNLPGYRDSSATLRYKIDSIAGGEYAVWTNVWQGGEARQTFRLAVQDGAEPSDTRLEFSQASKSYDKVWRKAQAPIMIYPGDKVLDVSIGGKATDRKIIGGFILEKIRNLPAGLSAESAADRRKVARLYRCAEPKVRLVLLEGRTASDLNAVYAALAAVAQVDPEVAVVSLAEDKAKKLNGELGLSDVPRVLLVESNNVIRHIWDGPFDKSTADQLANDLAHRSQLKDSNPRLVARAMPEPQALVDGRPAVWLAAGSWFGPAGLSLWGLDYEGEVRPNEGDPCVVERFDTVLQRQWSGLKLLSDFCYGDTPEDGDSIWSKGTVYANLYVHAEKDSDTVLHLAHTGVASYCWLNGQPVSVKPDWSKQAETLAVAPAKQSSDLGKSDQGASITVSREPMETPRSIPLALKVGWNRILLKLVIQNKTGELFAFKTRLTDSDGKQLGGIRTSISDPTPTAISRKATAHLIPTSHTNAPFNLAYEGEPLLLKVDLGSVRFHGATPDSQPKQQGLHQGLNDLYFPFSGTLELVVTDYDGREISRQTAEGAFPGTVTFDLGKAPSRGYYATQLKLYDQKHNLVTSYPPDGFSVIGGTAAQNARKKDKKMAVTYYFMASKDRYKTVYFPYMHRIGIFRNVGGTNGRAEAFYRYASEDGLYLSADFWNYRNPEYLDAYAKETAPYVDSFKAYNEIDIAHKERGTPESWVEKSKRDYEAIRKYSPNTQILGGSLARPGADDWFEQCLKLGLANYQSVWDVHCYPSKPPVLEGTMANSENETELGVLKILKKLGMENKLPFWIGETGARCSHGQDARRWQTDMVAKMVACALSRSDFQKIGFLVPWWYSREKGEIWDIEVGHMPAEAAYYTASALVDGFPYQRLALPPSIQAARFGPTLMAWNTLNSLREVSLKPEGSAPFLQVDVVGRVKELTPKKDGTVTVSLGSSPVYILSREAYDKLTAFGAKRD